MRIVFIGNVLFSKYALEKLVSMNENIVGVFTKEKSSFNSDFVDLSIICKDYKIPYFYIRGNINDSENIEILRRLKPDVIYCFGFSQILSKEILNIPTKGVIGFHPSFLPANRGRHPIIWALFLGLEKTASTFFMMDEGADSGDIISQVEVPIYYEDDAHKLYMRITETALKQIEELTTNLKHNNIRRIKQNNIYANYWRKRTELDGRIDFRMCSYAVYNLIRALSRPYVGADLIYKGKSIKVWSSKEEAVFLPNIEPGKVLDVDKNNRTILVKTYDGAIRLTEHEFDELPNVGEYLI